MKLQFIATLALGGLAAAIAGEMPTQGKCYPVMDFDTDGKGNKTTRGQRAENLWKETYGTKITTSNNAKKPAMLFDTGNFSGEDNDLKDKVEGMVLIISEDNDSSDPDDNAHGGTITFEFETPVQIESIGLFDLEEKGGRVKMWDAVGDEVVNEALAHMKDGKKKRQTFNQDIVGRMEITFTGSGALTDVTFCDSDTPRSPTPPTFAPAPTPGTCTKDDFLKECKHTRQCKDMYEGAGKCKKSKGGVCFCGDEVCGCKEDPEPPPGTCTKNNFLKECKHTRQCKDMYEGADDCNKRGGGVCFCGDEVCGCKEDPEPTPPPPPGTCTKDDFLKECKTTGECKDLYEGADDCKNSEGGVCFCGDDVCGCKEDPEPTPTPPPGTCTKDNFLKECKTTGECKDMYEGADDCKNSEGGVCFCGDEVCGCEEGPEPPPTPTDLPTDPPTSYPTDLPSALPSQDPGTCTKDDFLKECKTTGECKDMYEGADDCKNSEGGVCFCGDDVCGCEEDPDPVPTPTSPPGTCTKDDFLKECKTTGECKDLYEGADDCKNSEGGVCFCGDEVCGCEEDPAPPPLPPSPTEPPTDPPVTQAPTKEPTTQAPTREPTTQAPSKKPTTKAPTASPVTLAPTKPDTTSYPTKVPTTEAPSDPPVTLAPTRLPTTQAPTEPPVTESPNAGPPTDPPVRPPTGTTSGDPHFNMFSGHKFDFHGECDMVFVNNPDYNNGQGMKIHIRTKQVRWWSYVQSAVVQIGDDTLEVRGGLHSSDYWINGEQGPKLVVSGVQPFTVGGHKVRFRVLSDITFQYKIFLDGANGEAILLRSVKDWMKIDLQNHSKKTYGTSQGILGGYESGEMLARDGLTIFDTTDSNAYGLEWQVQEDEPMLFHNVEGPQHPEQCKMPASTTTQRRRLGENKVSRQVAENVCAFVEASSKKDCIFDVMAADDVEMAALY